MIIPADKVYENEGQLLAETLLEFGAHPHIWLWRENTGQAYGAGRVRQAAVAAKRGDAREAASLLTSMQPINYGIPGRGDIGGVIKLPEMAYGRPLGWEAKVNGGRRRPEQIKWADYFIKMGGFYVLFYQVSDIYKALINEGYIK